MALVVRLASARTRFSVPPGYSMHVRNPAAMPLWEAQPQ